MAKLGLVLALALGATGCPHAQDGPHAALTGISPEVVCNDQLSTVISVSGDALSPLDDLVLTKPQLELPQLTLTRTQGLDGAPVSPPESVIVPDDPLHPELSDLTWTNAMSMTFTVCPPGTCSTATPPTTDYTLSPGLFDLTARNRNGSSATLPNVLTVVPPPILESVVDLLCKDKNNLVTLHGDYFLRVDGVPITVTIGGQTFPATSMSDCRTLPSASNTTVEACKTAQVAIPAGAFSSGTYDVTVTGPSSAGCHTTTKAHITFVSEPTLQSIQPDLICDAQATQTLTLTGVGFLTVDGVLPTVHIGTHAFPAATATNCVPLLGPKEVVQVCTKLTVSIPVAALPEMKYPVTVTNPPPADCVTHPPIDLTVVPPPVLMSVAPSTVCAGGGTLTLGGTGFRTGATVSVGAASTTSVTVAADGMSAVAALGAANVGGPFDVTFANADGCSSKLTNRVTVVQGPLLLFVDPSVVWNGVATPVTLYGSGFVPPFGSAKLRARTSGTTTDVTAGLTTAPGHSDRPVVIVPKSIAADTYDVLVTDSSGCPAVLPNALKVVQSTDLQLTGISPKFGWTGASTAVTITSNAATPFDPLPRVYLAAGSTLVQLGAVARVTATSISALVPSGVPPGVYNVIVVNPQAGTVGVLTLAFTVLASPPPSVTSISPSQIPNTGSTAVTISGANFGTTAGTVTLHCLDPKGALYTDQVITTPTTWLDTSVVIQANGTPYTGMLGGPPGANCVVIVTTPANVTAEFSSLVVVTPTQDLTNWIQTGPPLNSARRGLGVVSGEATQAARFVYAIAGDDGAAASRSVEVLPVDIFGLPSSTGFFVQRNQLNSARTQTSAARIGRFIYVVGGTSTMGTDANALATVERSAILDPAVAPSNLNVDIVLDPTRGLSGGVYYYRVAAVLPGTDEFNANGETLPSEEFGIILPSLTNFKLPVTLSWNLVKDSTGAAAAGYLIYRTKANDPAGKEVLIADTRALPSTVTCTAPTATTASCTDNGAVGTTQTPLLLGSTGLWQTIAPTMTSRRQGPGVTFALDPVTPTTKAYVYAFGGKDETATTLATYELLPITINSNGSQTTGAWSTPATFGAARWDLRAWSSVLASGTYVWAGGGYPTGTATNASTETNGALLVGPNGALGAFTTDINSMPNEAGFGAFAASNFLYAVGGQGGVPDRTASSKQVTTPPGLPGGWMSAGQGLAVQRIDLGACIQSGYFYAVGGFGGTAMPFSVLKSIEYVLY